MTVRADTGKGRTDMEWVGVQGKALHSLAQQLYFLEYVSKI
jgi:hypothetical protein